MSPLPVALLLWAVAGIDPVSVTLPAYPPLATSGGTIVAALEVLAGVPQQVRILSGKAPFVASAQSALTRWKFAGSPGRARILAVVCYREPGMFSLGTTAHALESGREEPDLPFPTAVYEPAIPADSLGEGSVVLGITVRSDGSTSDIRVVRGAGNLTDAGIEAVSRWRFRAARDGGGNGMASEVFVVFVFRPPVTPPGTTRR